MLYQLLFSGAVFGLLGWIVYRRATKKQRLRAELRKVPFPTAWEKILQERVGFFHSLSEDDKEIFRKRVQFFLAEVRITGIKTEVDDVTKILVAASAIIPIFGYPDWEHRNLGEVLIFPGHLNNPFAEKGEKQEGYILGQVASFQNDHIMRLSKPSLFKGFQSMGDRRNVGIHEFAHIIDAADGVIDGIPSSYMSKDLVHAWTDLMYKEMKDIAKRKSTIRAYGATNEAEFFAVTTEYFFENPDLLKRKHPKLYELLSETFKQNPKHTFLGIDFDQVLHPNGYRVGRNSPCPCGSKKKYKRCCLQRNR